MTGLLLEDANKFTSCAFFFLLFLFVPPSSKGGDSLGIQFRNLLSRLKTQLCWIWGSCLLSSLNPSCFIKPPMKHSVAHSPCNLGPLARPSYRAGHQHLRGHAATTKPSSWKQFPYLMGFSSMPIYQRMFLTPFSLPATVPRSSLQARALRDALK